jgi:hypothetical protein
MGASVFTPLLKNNMGHRITTIGTGVPKFQSMSGDFKEMIAGMELFVFEFPTDAS